MTKASTGTLLAGALLLLAACGGGQEKQWIVVPGEMGKAPCWTTDPACEEESRARGGYAAVAVLKANGQLPSNPDVVQDMLGMNGREKLVVRIKTHFKVMGRSDLGHLDGGKSQANKSQRQGNAGAMAARAHDESYHDHLRKEFDRLSEEETELHLYGAKGGPYYENGDGRVWQLWTISPSELRRTMIGAGIAEADVDAMIEATRVRFQ